MTKGNFDRVSCEEASGPTSQDRDAQALACITNEQAFASWERFKAMRERYVAAVLETA